MSELPPMSVGSEKKKFKNKKKKIFSKKSFSKSTGNAGKSGNKFIRN